ncbi:type IV pilus twitching motility protein PilT [Sporosarcina sp. Marseille-Q4063]|uniref:type IV pilus twitching motility protein PilT n=1 Tax=Sporosarcina sp. Marseille-Q4063 TaxID=2810514 RepID=UPI001BAF38B5|nr:type IV pilus twitching motility protein PilT [Sporosarcina sp. Marseille-Q4063]QUW22504.1 type IV pilus twitching motility protein PilT [Sporosarcina sp. Marseille-Q4063]
MPNTIDKLLERANEEGASDLHLSEGIPAVYRIDGQLRQLDERVFSTPDLEKMAKKIIPKAKADEFEEKGETDFNYALGDICRFRVNAFHQRGEISIAARRIPSEIPSFEKLGMPAILYDLANKPQGLILVTGPTGSGKTTTLASMIDYINTNTARHIITLEDPIEYIHQHKMSIVNQREVGVDTNTFANGLRAALRQDPEIILVGEMRDLETISTAITAAETGHLVLATLHTSSAATTIDRIIDVFPPHQQSQVRIQLANVLQGVVSQRLFINKNGSGRVAATEILIQTAAIANLIRSEKVHQIQNVIQTSRSLGMHTLEVSIQQLITNGIINYSEAKEFLTEGDY